MTVKIDLKKGFQRFISDRGIKGCRGIPLGAEGMVSKAVCIEYQYAKQMFGRRHRR